MGPLAAKSLNFKRVYDKKHFTPHARPMAFKVGDSVEVCSNEDGFWGSYWEAIVVARLVRDNEYVVEYTTLLEDDLSGPLRQTVKADEVRPRPATRPGNIRYSHGARVDAYDNDGWWVGTVTGMDDEGKYCVYFDKFEVEVAYESSKLRLHHDWKKGRWLVPFSYGDEDLFHI